jgi:DNA mismatch endonuclease, patch repair protein
MEFWQGKFEANVARDNANKVALLSSGWRVATVWECALRTPAVADAAVDATSSWLVSGESELEIGEAEMILEMGCGEP